MTARSSEPVRLAAVVAAISLATDLGTGQPTGHALRTCHIAMGLARELSVTGQDAFDTYYLVLLRFLGCTSEATADAALNSGDDLALYAGLAPSLMGETREQLSWLLQHLAEGGSQFERARALGKTIADPKGAERSFRAHCEVGQMLSRHFGLGNSVIQALGCAFERWDGKGLPNGIGGEGVPVSCRIAIVARDFDLLTRVLGAEAAAEVLRKRRGRAYEPRVLDAALAHGVELLSELDSGSLWDTVLESEPGPPITVDEHGLDHALGAFALFTDLKSPFLHGHSTRVAELAQRAASLSGEMEPRLLRRAGLVHDLGRVGVPSGIWNKAGPLSDDEWERVRLHSYFTERILARCPPLTYLAEVASSHHERMDGSGYHRSLRPPSISAASRLLAAADVFVALTDNRPHRPAHTSNEAADLLHRAGNNGLLDIGCVRAVMEAGGMDRPPGRSTWPAGLTDREVDVLRLLASGLPNKQIARRLSVSPKTVGRHIEHIYAKLQVSTRAGATLFALEQGLTSQ